MTATLPITYLFVPADRPERFAKAMASGADRVVIDLEDGVAPDAKARARAALAGLDLDWRRIVLRINAAGSGFWADDLAALARIPAVSVMLPKAEGRESIAAVIAAAGRAVEVIPQIETVRGLVGIDALLAAPGVARVAFGHLDFAVDLGAAPDWQALLLARSSLVMQSRAAARAAPIDGITTDLKDEAVLRSEAAAARRLGFGAKLLIHPRQVAPVADVFAPTAAEIDWAERVLAALADGVGVASLDGRMIDRPVAEAARVVLSRAGRRG